jgi:outer membrane protein assembly factor BamB
VPRPVYGAGLVFITTGFQQPSLLAVRPDGKGDVTRTHVAWKLSRGAPLTPSPLLAGDELYVVTDNGIASCLDARTGAVHWQQRLGNSFSVAGPAAAASFPRRGRGAPRRHAGDDVRGPGGQHPGRRDAGVDGRRCPLVLHPHRDAFVQDRWQLIASPDP